jgi:hypothetical protein
MLTNLEKQIVATIAYYDELDYPLTVFEVWKYLTNIDGRTEGQNGPNTLEAVGKSLDEERLKEFLRKQDGFYFLKGRQELVAWRLMNNKIASRKLKKLRKIVWLLRLIPFVRMIAVTGRLAMKNTGKNSDWDLFIVLKRGKIWTGRTLVTAIIHLMKKRRYGDKIKDRICLNYFVTDASLQINTKKRPFEVNLFTASEYSFMIPLFGFKYFRKFQIRNNWMSEFKPNFEIPEVRAAHVIADTHFSKVFRKCGERVLKFDFIEAYLRKIETEKIAHNPKTSTEGNIIAATDDELVFLPEPQGKEIYERCREKLIALGAYF